MLFPEAMILAAADQRVCRDALRVGSRSFYAASHLLPQRVREPATALYAFCRLADDAIDLDPGARRSKDALARLNDRLDRVYRNMPLPQPADRAFAEVVRRFHLPRALPDALLEGLAWDAETRRYETLSDLLAYAARVAGAVGAMMAVVMGVRDRAALARACDLGAAMQLTNIARDIGEDARAGRLYMPLSWMREAGLDPETWLAAPRFTPAIGALTQRLLVEAERLYRQGDAGIAALPRGCRPGIKAARAVYAAIGHEITQAGFDSVTRRAIVPKRQKLALCLRALLPHWGEEPSAGRRPVQPEARFLVDAVTPIGTNPSRPTWGEQIVWVLDLFERVDARRAERMTESGV